MISNATARRYEQIQKLLLKLSEKSKLGAAILVEGIKDEESLRAIGICGNIFTIKNYRGRIYDFLESIASNFHEAIVLTDFDLEGDSLAAEVSRELAHMRVKTDILLRRQLGANLRPDIRSVQELRGFIENTESDIRKKSIKKLRLD